MSDNICTNHLTFHGKSVNDLTNEELKQALLTVYNEGNKFKDLYFKALDAKAELMTDFISNKLNECKRLTTKNS